MMSCRCCPVSQPHNARTRSSVWSLHGRSLLGSSGCSVSAAFQPVAAWMAHTAPLSTAHTAPLSTAHPLHLPASPVPCSPNDNQYAHPVDMVPIVDLNLRKVVHIDRWGEGDSSSLSGRRAVSCVTCEVVLDWGSTLSTHTDTPCMLLTHPDACLLPACCLPAACLLPACCLPDACLLPLPRYPGKAPPVPMTDDNYHAELFPGEWRKDIKPLNVVQPEVRHWHHVWCAPHVRHTAAPWP
jgi:hypothetical protein